ncbi:cytochrome P460 family protein [Microvirga puerhi]|uniref:Cytochrome P460 family protein n=1 Tax=Microvirga puerhi TaxID=2876078 RepID=A0ABS7VTP1_9HYPH|nr:cytochrome P460 family protein [Microvirga puerhi]MBZ6078420.1 cytochrome P460 family protein [Microvirga puerhi]
MRLRLTVAVALCAALLLPSMANASEQCPAQQETLQVPTDLALCASLEDDVRKPSQFTLDVYQQKLGIYLRAYCHRNPGSGWKTDKTIRDTGPFTAALKDEKWVGTYHGTHAPVVIWYSPEMYAWLKVNRPADEHIAPTNPAPVPNGAMMIKEMYPAPAAACRGIDVSRLQPTSGAAVMVRDNQGAHDGWFWGWFGWKGWEPDWPAQAGNGYPNMGFGQYCVNCHASAKDNFTFAALRNIKGEAGKPLAFLSQHWFQKQGTQPDENFAALLNHLRIVQESDDVTSQGAAAHSGYDPAFTQFFGLPFTKPERLPTLAMPSQTYDNVWARAGMPKALQPFLTSDQCIGCHDAGSTGLQFDMTQPGHGGKFLNLSPFGTWSTSPMGLAGRDPVFFAQLSSETKTFHPESSKLVEDTCLGCHGVMGQRQFKIDEKVAGRGCTPFSRDALNATPFPAGPHAKNAAYGALGRDGVSCTTCHTMALSESDRAKVAGEPQNSCVAERQAFLNPDNNGFARTFTGSFLTGAPDKIIGPFPDPKVKPMENALGLTPAHNAHIQSAEVCGSCHTVHLPVLNKGKVIGHTYEQTTYAEWAFSDYRTGRTPDGLLPMGPGAKAETCQGCHMPSKDAQGQPIRSKIASIQEHSNFPEADNTLEPEDIDLEIREGFASHVLVGLNTFLIKMAQQFPDIMGIRTQDPMLTRKGLDPLLYTEQAIAHQAEAKTADIRVSNLTMNEGAIEANILVTNKAGHKFPSGVGFRRAFVEFQVLDRDGATLWSSGRTNTIGALIDEKGEPIDGEVWWSSDCSVRKNPLAHQPHYQVITQQNQAQIYQELVSSPPADGPAQCGIGSRPAGELTTSFLSICSNVKDNRLLPKGFLKRNDRIAVAQALGAGSDLADEAGPAQVGDDPDYETGGSDTIRYQIDLAQVKGVPATVQATLYYQATPPFYLQDRFCTSKGTDTERLYFMTSRLNLEGSKAENWKLRMVSTGQVALPQP